MKVTGERFMPDYPGDWSPEHYHRYFLARELVEGKRDCIMVLEQGRIIERGTHEQLIEEKGRYYQLYTGNAISA